MARLKVDSKVPADYEAMKVELSGDKGFCSVVAVAAIARIPAKQAQELLAQHGRKHGHGTKKRITKAVLESLGYEVRPMTFKERRAIIDSYPGRHKGLVSITTHHPRRFAAAWAGQPDMLMFSHAHVSAYVDGEVKDWAIKHSKQVYDIWLVEKKA